MTSLHASVTNSETESNNFEGGDGQADLLTPVVIIVFNFYEHILESLEKKYFMSLIFICLEPGIGF